jgi:hypothetical protein
MDLIDKIFVGLGFVVLVAAWLGITFFAVRLFRRHPSTFTVAVLGFPNTGKTVFITTLFDQLQQGRSKHLHLTPYGLDTVEEVTRNLNVLSKGMWLPRTAVGNVFFFRAVATARDLMVSRLKLEIGDFAGEDIGELQPSSERWLHKSDYFKYVVDADAIMLAIDGGSLTSDRRDGADQIVNAFVAAVQIIADYKGATGERRLRTPIALLVMKSDLFDEQRRGQIADRLRRLTAVCEGRCRQFKMFFVSSTGPLEDGNPPVAPHPESVVEPLEWAVERSFALTPRVIIENMLRPSPSHERQRWDSYR